MNRRAFLRGSLTSSVPVAGRPAGRPPSDTMPEYIAAWYRSAVDATYERLAEVEDVWAVFVRDARRSGTAGGVLTITHWDGVSFDQDEIRAPAFQDFTVSVHSDYLDVEVDATVPYQTGVSSMARPSLIPNAEERQTLDFNLVLGVRSRLSVYRQGSKGRTVVLQLRAATSL